ncbi:MAG: hypothetical protein ACLQE9_13500 [Roseiarcus sp.]
MSYEIIWSSRFGGQRAKKVDGAAMAQAWVGEYRDKGADKIVIKREGKQVSEADLVEFMKSESDEARNATRP